MAMEITGKVVQMLAEQTGNGKNGTWKKRDFILESDGKYPKKVCISVWGEKIEQFNIREGQTLTVSVEVESREYNGKWYTDVKAWRVSGQGQNQSQNQGGSDNYSNAGPPSIPSSAYSKAEIPNVQDDDLPF